MDEAEITDAAALAVLDQVAAAAREAHGPGHTREWYEAVAARMIWYQAHDGSMVGCPFVVPD